MQYPGQAAAGLLAEEAHEGSYLAFVPSVEAAYTVGSVVVRELATHWDKYEKTMPGAE